MSQLFTPKGFNIKAQGKRSAALGYWHQAMINPERVESPNTSFFSLDATLSGLHCEHRLLTQGSRFAATLGLVIQSLRDKEVKSTFMFPVIWIY